MQSEVLGMYWVCIKAKIECSTCRYYAVRCDNGFPR